MDKNSKIVKAITKRYLTITLLTRNSSRFLYKFHDTYRKMVDIIDRTSDNIL